MQSDHTHFPGKQTNNEPRKENVEKIQNNHILPIRSGTAATRPRVRTVGKVRNLFEECRCCCCCCNCFPLTSPADQSWWWSLFSEPISESEEEADPENPSLISEEEEEEEAKPELEEEEGGEKEMHLWWEEEDETRVRDCGEEMLTCAEGAQGEEWVIVQNFDWFLL